MLFQRAVTAASVGGVVEKGLIGTIVGQLFSNDTVSLSRRQFLAETQFLAVTWPSFYFDLLVYTK